MIQTQRNGIQVKLPHDSCLEFMLGENGFIIRTIGLDAEYSLTDAEFEAIAKYYRGRHVSTLTMHLRQIELLWDHMVKAGKIKIYERAFIDNYLTFRAKCLVELGIYGRLLAQDQCGLNIDQTALLNVLEVN